MEEIRALLRSIAMSLPQAYEIFGLQPGQPVPAAQDLKRLYRRLSRERHPDLNPELGQEPMKLLNDAYDTLVESSERGSGTVYTTDFGSDNVDDESDDWDGIYEVDVTAEGSVEQVEEALRDAERSGADRQSRTGPTVVAVNPAIEEIYVGSVGSRREVVFGILARPVPAVLRRQFSRAEVVVGFQSRATTFHPLREEAGRVASSQLQGAQGWTFYGLDGATAWVLLQRVGVTADEWGRVFRRAPTERRAPEFGRPRDRRISDG